MKLIGILLIAMLGLASFVVAIDTPPEDKSTGLTSGTYGTGENQVKIKVTSSPIHGDYFVTYIHNGKTIGPREAGPHPDGGVSNAPPVTFEDDKRQYRVRNGEAQWSTEDDDAWAPLQKQEEDNKWA